MKKDSKGNETNLVKYRVSSKPRAQHHTSFAVWFQFLDMSCFLQPKNFKNWEGIRIADRVSRTMGHPGLGLIAMVFLARLLHAAQDLDAARQFHPNRKYGLFGDSNMLPKAVSVLRGFICQDLSCTVMYSFDGHFSYLDQNEIFPQPLPSLRTGGSILVWYKTCSMGTQWKTCTLAFTRFNQNSCILDFTVSHSISALQYIPVVVGFETSHRCNQISSDPANTFWTNSRMAYADVAKAALRTWRKLNLGTKE